MTPIAILAAAAIPTAAAPADPPAAPMFEVHGEVRARGETRDDLDFNPARESTSPGWNDGERLLLRTRIGVTGRPTDYVTVFGQIQDSRLFGQEASTASNEANLDLHQGWVELHDLEGLPFALRVGRMELSYGDQRLVGAFGWDNVGRAFDGLQARTWFGDFALDAFYTRLHADVWNDPTRSLGDDFAGLYLKWNGLPQLQVDAYVFALLDRGGKVEVDGELENRLSGAKDMQIYTPGLRIDARPVTGLHFNGEAALQVGHRGEADVSAWAFHAAVDYTLPVATAPKLLVGYDAASGDADANDDEWGTFENLFPTNHDKYGLMDLASWKNLQDIYFGAGFDPVKAVKFQATVHLLARNDTEDTFYRANGTPLVDRALAMQTDAKNVGTELDLTLDWKVTQGFGVLVGYSRLWAGEFLDETLGGGDEAPNADFGYLQLTGSF